ncbi:hypothetical protein Tco_1409320 [Tanacetum coccineum]
MGDTIAQTRFENVSKLSNDLLLARGNILQSDEDRLKLDKLMALCTTLQSRVLDLEKTKTTQANETASLKSRVKKLEKKSRSRTHKLKRLYKVGLTAKMFDVDALNGEEVFIAGQNENVVEEVVNAAQVSTVATTFIITTEEITLAQALKALKTSKPKVKWIVFQEPAEFDEEERLSREKAKKEKEANIALIETWDDIQAKIDVAYQLAKRLQAQEQEELSDAENATLFQQLLEKRKKDFAAKKTEEKRNKPPKKAQLKKTMCTYLKNMEGYKLNDLKLKDFDSIQKIFDRAFKRVITFEDFRTELVKGKEKREGTELIQENTKKQKVEDDKETAELKQLMKIIPDEEEVAIDAIPLAVKSPSIVGWKIYKEGRKSYYQIMRADGKSQMYMFFSQMLKNFDREDLEDLYKLVKAKFESTKPVEDLDLLLWGDLKTMFEPHVEDAVWRNQQAYKVLDWKLYDSCGVHSLRMQHMQIYMLVEKKYPLAPLTLSMMLEKKLNIDYESEMAYQLLKLIIKQLKK